MTRFQESSQVYVMFQLTVVPYHQLELKLMPRNFLSDELISGHEQGFYHFYCHYLLGYLDQMIVPSFFLIGCSIHQLYKDEKEWASCREILKQKSSKRS